MFLLFPSASFLLIYNFAAIDCADLIVYFLFVSVLFKCWFSSKQILSVHLSFCPLMYPCCECLLLGDVYEPCMNRLPGGVTVGDSVDVVVVCLFLLGTSVVRGTISSLCWLILLCITEEFFSLQKMGMTLLHVIM